MTPIKIMEAYKAIHELAHCVFPYRVTRTVHALKKRLSEEFNILLEAEKTMVEKYGGNMQNGTYHFDSKEIATQFHEEYQNFLNQDDENINLPHVDLSKNTDAINVSLSAMEALDGIVYFGDE